MINFEVRISKKIPDVRILWNHSENSLARAELWSLCWGAISSRVSWRNFAISNLTFRFCLILSSRSFIVWKVDGNIPGKSFMNTGSNNSMNGTIIKTENGTSRNMSPTVLLNRRYSLLDNVFPFRTRHTKTVEIFTSMKSNRNP